MMPRVRTTLTLDDETAAKLKEAAQRQGLSFKEVVNRTLERGLNAQERSARQAKRFRVTPFRSAFKAGVDPLKLNQLVDALEAEHAREALLRAVDDGPA